MRPLEKFKPELVCRCSSIRMPRGSKEDAQGLVSKETVITRRNSHAQLEKFKTFFVKDSLGDAQKLSVASTGLVQNASKLMNMKQKCIVFHTFPYLLDYHQMYMRMKHQSNDKSKIAYLEL